jgi:hypothetical protein
MHTHAVKQHITKYGIPVNTHPDADVSIFGNRLATTSGVDIGVKKNKMRIVII